MSGSLPRDLLRVCRELMEVKNANPNALDLSSLFPQLIYQDVASKLRAISIASQQVKLQAEVSGFLALLGRLRAADLTTDILISLNAGRARGRG